MKIQGWRINKTGVLFTLASLLTVSISSCNIFGTLDNPLDPGADTYQGFTTVTKSSDIRPESPEDGGRLDDGFLTISEVIGATAYEIRIAETAAALDTSPVFQKSDYVSNILDLRGSSLDALRPYYWKARAYRDGVWDEAWSNSAEFIPWYPYSWSQRDSFSPTMAFSLDGMIQYKFVGGGIEVSLDSGQTWVLRLPGSCINVTTNDDGNVAVAIFYTDDTERYLYISHDTGQTWLECISAGVKIWCSVAVNQDGSRIIAADSAGFLYTSSDGGLTWSSHSGPGERNWRSVDCSSDGKTLIATDCFGPLFVSKDYGNTWKQCEPLQEQVIWGIVDTRCNNDGSHLIHIHGEDYIYQSYDYGTTWKKLTPLGARYWEPLSMNNDGSIIAVGCRMADDKKSLWMSNDSGRTWNSISLADPGYEDCITIHLFDRGRKIYTNMNSANWEGAMLSW